MRNTSHLPLLFAVGTAGLSVAVGGTLGIGIAGLALGLGFGWTAAMRSPGVVALQQGVEASVQRRTAWLETEVDELRRKAQVADQASLAKSAFLANMSHELRTPLTAITGYTEMLSEELDDLPPSAVRRDLDRIQGSATHLLGLIDDLLDIARIEAGTVGLTLEPVRLSVVVQQSIGAIGPVADEKGLAMFDDVGAEHVAYGDALRIQQILLNLLSNAVKFTDTGGIHVVVQERGASLALHVQDTGCGVPADEHERLFERYHRAHAPHAPLGGPGLGLAIARDLARLMGGDLTVRSEPGRGSTFTLLMPRYVPQPVASEPTRPRRLTPVS